MLYMFKCDKMQPIMLLTNKHPMTKAMNYVCLKDHKTRNILDISNNVFNTRCVITSNYNNGSGQTTKI